MTATRALQLGDRSEQSARISRRQLMDRQARQREAGDVHFLDRAPGILQAIERRLGDELEAGGAQLFEQRAQRDPSRAASCSRSASEKPDTARSMRPRATSRTRSTAARGLQADRQAGSPRLPAAMMAVQPSRQIHRSPARTSCSCRGDADGSRRRPFRG